MTLLAAPLDDASTALGTSYPHLISAASGFFRSRGVPFDEANDLGQETIVRTLVHLKRHGQRGDDLKPLLFTIARNLLAERARKHATNVVALSEHIDVADDAPSPLDRVVQSEERSAVANAVSSLAPRHRRVIELWMAGEAPGDIARSLGIKRNAADALLHRARRRLASVLRESGAGAPAVIGLWRGRLRFAMQRVASFFEHYDPTSIVGQAVGAVAVVSIAGAIGAVGASPAHVASSHVASVPAVAHVSSVTKPLASTAAADRKSSQNVSPRSLYANVADQRVSAHTDVKDPTTNKSVPVGIDVWRDPGSGTSHTATVLDTGTKILCARGCPSVGGGQ